MLDSFLVALEDKADALIPYALSVAKTLNARVTAAYPRRDLAGYEDGSLEARLEAASGGGAARKTQARHLLEMFAEAAKAAAVDAETLFPDAGEDPLRDVLPRFARAFDFVMVQQREPGRAPARDDLAAALLSESGRPVWVVPAIQRDPAQFKRVLVAWDGGAAPARAFSEAKGIIARAAHVEFVTVTHASTHNAVIQGGERLAARLKAAGVDAAYRRIPSEENPAQTLLSYAADVAADLLVSGGYSRSPLRESLFGGTTRSMLASMTLPVFFAH
jgi:nucleotide-binding universal stress UspA family protein